MPMDVKEMYKHIVKKTLETLGMSAQELAKYTETSTGFISNGKNKPTKSQITNLKFLLNAGWIRSADEYEDFIKRMAHDE